MRVSFKRYLSYGVLFKQLHVYDNLASSQVFPIDNNLIKANWEFLQGDIVGEGVSCKCKAFERFKVYRWLEIVGISHVDNANNFCNMNGVVF